MESRIDQIEQKLQQATKQLRATKSLLVGCVALLVLFMALGMSSGNISTLKEPESNKLILESQDGRVQIDPDSITFFKKRNGTFQRRIVISTSFDLAGHESGISFYSSSGHLRKTISD